MAKTKTDPEVTDFTPEKTGQPLTPQQEQAAAFRRKLSEFAAACNREYNRIATEHAVRIGDSIIHEAHLCEAISEILEEHEKQYLEFSKNPE